MTVPFTVPSYIWLIAPDKVVIAPLAPMSSTVFACRVTTFSAGSTKVGESTPLPVTAAPTVQGNRGLPCGPGASRFQPLPIVTGGGCDVCAGSLPKDGYTDDHQLRNAESYSKTLSTIVAVKNSRLVSELVPTSASQ